jgi:ribulose-phosphate 3-epimerase
MFKLAPSILSADFSKLAEEIKKIEVEGVQYVHVDVMDGHFVPNITIGALVVKSLRKTTKLPFDVHLMISDPEKYSNDFIKAGADVVTIHVESEKFSESVLKDIRSKGVMAGISIKPKTELKAIEKFYDMVDLILVMTVEPGFGGQSLIGSTLDKVRELKSIKEKKGYKFIIEVDGGVTEENIHEYVKAGAELVVAGNAIFAAKDPVGAITNLLVKGAK